MKDNGFKLAKERSRRYPTQTITDANYANDIAILASTPAQAEALLLSLERTAGGIGFHVNAHKTDYMCFNKRGDISTLIGSSLNYHGSSVSSTETDISTWLKKAWAAIDRLSVIQKSEQTDKIKRNFFQAAVLSILRYWCTKWMLTECMKKKLDGNHTRMLRAILNKSWWHYPTKQQLYGHLPLITKTIQVRRTRLTGHCRKSKDELISDILWWTPSHGRAKTGRPARTCLQQLCADTGCGLEDLQGAKHDRVLRERVPGRSVLAARDDYDDNKVVTIVEGDRKLPFQ